MQQQRTIFTQNEQQDTGLVTVAAFGMKRRAIPGKTVQETLNELDLAPQPYQEIRVSGGLVDLDKRTLKSGDIVTITNRVAGGWGLEA